MEPTLWDALLPVVGCMFALGQLLGLMFYLEVDHKPVDSEEAREGHRFSATCFILANAIGTLFLCLYLERNPFLWMVLATMIGIVEFRVLPWSIKIVGLLLHPTEKSEQ